MTTSPQASRRIVLLGDTRDLYHHGCEAVITQILDGLGAVGLAPDQILPGLAWQNHKAACADADLVVINGEGSLHDSKSAVREIIELAEVRKKSGRPTALINTSWFRNDASLTRRLPAFDLVAVRESLSRKELSDQGVNAMAVPDLAIRQALRLKTQSQRQHTTRISVSDSTKPVITRQLINLSRRHNWDYLPVLSQPILQRPGAKARKIRSRFRLGRLLGPFARFVLSPRYHAHLVGARDLEEYCVKLGAARGVVTGRFHTACFALGLEVPVLAVASNTPKIESLLSDAGLDVKRRVIELSRLGEVADVPAYDETEIASLRAFLEHTELASQQLFTAIKGRLDGR